jgi:YidC/Oxa1 family membrane protein insertase
MEKRVLIAVFLSFLVLYAYDALVRPGEPVQPRPADTAGRTSSTPPPASEPSVPPETPPQTAAADPSLPEPQATVADDAERTLTVETRTVIATLSNRGGQITTWRLKNYRNEQGEPVDLVPEGLPADTARPLALRVEDASLTRRINSALYQMTSQGQGDAGRLVITQPTAVEFEYQDEGGLHVRKTVRFEPDGYIFSFSASVSSGGAQLVPSVQWGPGLGDTVYIAGESSSFAAYVQKPQGILFREGSAERLPAPQVREQPVYEGDFGFAGLDDHYFIATVVRPGQLRVRYEPLEIPLPDAAVKRELMAWEMTVPSAPADVRLFFGPKDFDVLAAVDRTLVKAIHFGVLDFLAVPLLRALKWINAFVGNYGWSIIILTILINLLMFPLRHKSVVSMRKMQELQPQVKAIQERYAKYKATDPERQKMNQEMMALYREKGVNPASGCLPMLLTMPVLFAFYSLLSVAIEMRGAPFALWIQDLSRHDPYYVTPLIMGATMIVQQRMTPIADPTQAKIMMLTPVIFLFFFLWAPSGLVIYWTVSNVLAVGQQYLTNRIIGKPVMKQVRPPAERRVKNVGAGRTEGARKA